MSPFRVAPSPRLHRRIEKVDKTGPSDITYDSYFTTNWQVLEVREDDDADPLKQFVWGLRYVDDLVVRYWDENTDGAGIVAHYALTVKDVERMSKNMRGFEVNCETIADIYNDTEYAKEHDVRFVCYKGWDRSDEAIEIDSNGKCVMSLSKRELPSVFK